MPENPNYTDLKDFLHFQHSKPPKSGGRPFQAVLDEALRDYIDRQQRDRSRRCRHVMTAFAASIDEFDDLYRELTK